MGYAYSQEKIQMSINYEKHGQHHQPSRKYKLTQYNFPLPDFFLMKNAQVLVKTQETRQLLALLGEVQPLWRAIWQQKLKTQIPMT